MRNLTAPKQYTDDKDRTTFDAGSEGLVLYTPAGEPVRLHVGADGFLYINDQPFGVQGMPPALHAAMHSQDGGDPITPAAIGAVSASSLTTTPSAGGVPVLGESGRLHSGMIAGEIDPAAHAARHASGGIDAITPASIGAVHYGDTRLTDKRTPKSHAESHAKGGTDTITPASIGAIPEDDARLYDSRTPKTHRMTHHKNGPDPISWEDVGSVDAGLFTVRERIPGGYPQLNDVGHIDVNLLPSSALLPGVHASSHAADGDDSITPVSINAADRSHTHGDADITSVDASKVTSGVLDIARIPQGALERLVIVSNQAAMLALTSADVQVGDTVQCADTSIMYRVIDETALGTMGAFVEYSAGRAAAVSWTGVEGKPASYTPSKHATSHVSGGVDQITPGDIGAATSAQLANHTATIASTSVFGHVNLDALAADGSNTAAPGGFGLGKTLSTVTDFNNCVVNGWYYGSNSAANRPPVATNYHVFVQALNSSNVLQKAYQVSGNSYYTRVRSSGVWSAWVLEPKGITDSTSTTSSTIAASATAVKALAARISALEMAMASAVRSTNIATITGTELTEGGVGYIEYTPR